MGCFYKPQPQRSMLIFGIQWSGFSRCATPSFVLGLLSLCRRYFLRYIEVPDIPILFPSSRGFWPINFCYLLLFDVLASPMANYLIIEDKKLFILMTLCDWTLCGSVMDDCSQASQSHSKALWISWVPSRFTKRYGRNWVRFSFF